MFSSELRVEIERVARGLVVVRVVHAARDGGVVVAEDRRDDEIAHEIGTLVRRAAVADRVTETVVTIDRLSLECLDDGSQSFVVGVDVAQDAETHGGRRCGG